MFRVEKLLILLVKCISPGPFKNEAVDSLVFFKLNNESLVHLFTDKTWKTFRGFVPFP